MRAMSKRTLTGRLCVGLVLGAVMTLTFAAAAQAADSAAPGRSVGRVFLGMDRADVWKILGWPGLSAAVPHGTALYGEDRWAGGGHRLWVISERDKVVQVEFNSPRITTTDGLSTESTLAQVRRRHPAMTVRAYRQKVSETISGQTSLDFFHLDDVRSGIAFTYLPPEEGMPKETDETAPKKDDELETIIIHRPGVRAIPIADGRWSAASRNPEGLRLLRGWFTPGGARRGGT